MSRTVVPSQVRFESEPASVAVFMHLTALVLAAWLCVVVIWPQCQVWCCVSNQRSRTRSLPARWRYNCERWGSTSATSFSCLANILVRPSLRAGKLLILPLHHMVHANPISRLMTCAVIAPVFWLLLVTPHRASAKAMTCLAWLQAAYVSLFARGLTGTLCSDDHLPSARRRRAPFRVRGARSTLSVAELSSAADAVFFCMRQPVASVWWPWSTQLG
jgi:hypothetical protein